MPDPETPVTHVIWLKGNLMSKFFRLFFLIPETVKNFVDEFTSLKSLHISFFPSRYCIVSEFLAFLILDKLPEKTILPPLIPASGPTSTILSADRIVSSSCSTTKTVFPLFFKSFKESINLELSLGCNPIVGSSRTYVTPVKFAPSCEANLILCASPPDKVGADLLSVK